MAEDPQHLEAYYATNNHFPDGMPNPKAHLVKKPVAVNDLPTLFKHSQYLSYATEYGKRMRGSQPIPGPEAGKYNITPPEPSDDELIKNALIAWHPRTYGQEKTIPDFIPKNTMPKKESCSCKTREEIAKEEKSSGISF